MESLRSDHRDSRSVQHLPCRGENTERKFSQIFRRRVPPRHPQSCHSSPKRNEEAISKCQNCNFLECGHRDSCCRRYSKPYEVSYGDETAHCGPAAEIRV